MRVSNSRVGESPATTLTRRFQSGPWRLTRKGRCREVGAAGLAPTTQPFQPFASGRNKIAFRMLHLIHGGCQVCAGQVILNNLLQFRRRVQQLLVRAIFLQGISDSAQWTRNLKFL
jgi:hypothetical protein